MVYSNFFKSHADAIRIIGEDSNLRPLKRWIKRWKIYEIFLQVIF